MSDGPDLVSLLYRADWTRLSLSADVRVSLDRDLVRSPPEDGAAPGPGSWLAFGRPWGPWPGLASLAGSLDSTGPMGLRGRSSREPGHEWAEATKVAEVLGTETGRSTLLVAPGRRYRQQGEGTLSGSDGERGWRAVMEDGSWTVTGTGGPEPPLEELLRPSWLLAGFTLEIIGHVTVDGRDALKVTATPRLGLWEQAAPLGDWLVGYWLVGHWLVGDWLVGHWLTGDWLVGHWLTGYWLAGYWLVEPAGARRGRRARHPAPP